MVTLSSFLVVISCGLLFRAVNLHVHKPVFENRLMYVQQTPVLLTLLLALFLDRIIRPVYIPSY